VWDELNTLARESITSSELEMTQNKIESNLVKEMETNLGCARRLGYFFLLSGDPDFPRRYQEELKRVTSADIQAVIQKYLTEQNVTVAEIISKPTTASRKNSAGASSGNTAAPSEKSSGRGIHR
jgi:predicted Zn-dependent peptidase